VGTEEGQNVLAGSLRVDLQPVSQPSDHTPLETAPLIEEPADLLTPELLVELPDGIVTPTTGGTTTDNVE
jgi:hypothetical protein